VLVAAEQSGPTNQRNGQSGPRYDNMQNSESKQHRRRYHPCRSVNVSSRGVATTRSPASYMGRPRLHRCRQKPRELFVGRPRREQQQYQTILFTQANWNTTVRVTLHAIPNSARRPVATRDSAADEYGFRTSRPHTFVDVGTLISMAGAQARAARSSSRRGNAVRKKNTAITERPCRSVCRRMGLFFFLLRRSHVASSLKTS